MVCFAPDFCGEDDDETGIIVAGRDYDGRNYVRDDRSGRYAPIEWAREAVALYQKYGAERVVAEVWVARHIRPRIC